MSDEPIGIGAVGYGYWGPNVVRNLMERPEFDLRALCELDETRATEFSRRYPGIAVESDFEEMLADDDIEAVAIMTRPHTHFALARMALDAGKHVLVEKPLARTSAEAEELVALADRNELVLMPGHTFLYSPPVVKVRNLIDEGVLGETYFVTSSRMNLGQYQPDGVICDLAPHDLSILLYWFDQPLVQLSATGCSAFQEHVPETAFLTLQFAGGAAANVQLSWLAPKKMRQMVVVGSKRMVQYDDTAVDEPVRIYDRGLDFELAKPENFGEYKLTYRSGDLVIPRVDPSEPLALELKDFASAVREGTVPRSNAALGLRIVRALEAADASLRQRGAPVIVDDHGTYSPAALLGATNGHRNGNGNGHRNGNGNGNGSGNGNGTAKPFTRWQSAPDRHNNPVL